MTVDEAARVKPGERVEHGVEHFGRFLGRERTRGQEIGEYLVGALGDDVEVVFAVDVAVSDVEDTQEVGVGEFGRGGPLGEEVFGIRRTARNQLQGAPAGWSRFDLGEEDTTVLSSAQPSEQGESRVDGQTDAFAGGGC